MNILLANISRLKTEPEEMDYKVLVENCRLNSFKAKHTNESVFKCLNYMDDVVETGGIEKVIMLVSNDVLNLKNEKESKTSLEYYCDIVISECEKKPIFVQVRVEDDDKQPRQIHSIIKDVCANISENDRVYIDAAGGQRTINQAIQLLTKMLKYKGIENPYSLYANIQNKQGYIEDTNSFDKLLKLTESFNEFMTTCKSNQLLECLEESKSHEQYMKLIAAMSEITDKISLGNLGMLESSLSKLRLSLKDCETVQSDDVFSVVTNEFLPLIRNKFFGNDDNADAVDYCGLVRWCLDNGLTQQALTLFVEKIPISLFDRGIIKINEETVNKQEDETRRNPLKSVDWQTNALYGDYLGEDKSLVNEAKKYLKDQQRTKKNSSFVNEFERQYRYFCEGEFDKMNQILLERIRLQNVTDPKKFCNVVHNNEEIIKLLAGVSKKKEDSLSSKFSAVSRIASGIKDNNGYYSNIDNDILLPILYGYIYVKSIRNLANHASSEEQLDVEKKNTLAKFGFNPHEYNIKTISSNISIALNAIESISYGKKGSNMANERDSRTEKKDNDEVFEIKVELVKPKILGTINLDSIKGGYRRKRKK